MSSNRSRDHTHRLSESRGDVTLDGERFGDLVSVVWPRTCGKRSRLARSAPWREESARIGSVPIDHRARLKCFPDLGQISVHSRSVDEREGVA
jgi:hypothetical protein